MKELPCGLDGLASFTIRNVPDIKTRRKVLSSDGRRWLKDSTTSWASYGRMRFANCRGSRICNNNNFPYKKEYGVINKLQFNKDNTCTACGTHADLIYCPARRYIQIKQTKLNIFHCGLHTCPVRSQSSEKPVETVKEMFKKNPNLKPSEVQSALLVSSLQSEQAGARSMRKPVRLLTESGSKTKRLLFGRR